MVAFSSATDIEKDGTPSSVPPASGSIRPSNASSLPGKNGNLSLKEKCMQLLESNGTTSFMMIVTVYALYSDDLRILCFDPSSDFTFMVISSVAFFLFVAEIALQCWCREKYLQLPCVEELLSVKDEVTWQERLQKLRSVIRIGSFFFWLDLLATFSMVFEVRLDLSLSAYRSECFVFNKCGPGPNTFCPFFPLWP